MYEQQVDNAIKEAIEELKHQLEPGKSISNDPSTLLYGIDARLDSLDLVTLIILTEQKVQDKTGKSITLANEKALSMRSSPFRSVGSLREYVMSLLQEVSG
jgi:acyl carrier protein